MATFTLTKVCTQLSRSLNFFSVSSCDYPKVFRVVQRKVATKEFLP